MSVATLLAPESNTLDQQFPNDTTRKPLRVAFIITSMPVGGAETLLVNLIRGLDRSRFEPEIICLKERGPLGEIMSAEIPVSHSLLRGKLDFTILPKLISRLRSRRIDAVITVGAGDKMFWGRLAAKLSGVPVIGSALHSTGWPDGVGKLNRMLTRITDTFIAVADSHGKFMIDFEGFPASKVNVIRNGIDTQRFVPDSAARDEIRSELKLFENTPLVGIVAALRSEKNHALYVDIAACTLEKLRNAHFVIIGEGPERANIEAAIASKGLEKKVHLLGSRSDTPRLLAALDCFLLTSHNEANPVSILEALSCCVPVVSTRVGSIAETVIDGETGYTVEPGDVEQATRRVLQILLDTRHAEQLGRNGRELVERTGSLDSMVCGYQELIEKIYTSKINRC
jgi:glycosyltransferase involved in cell wall biosynthesis